jgi:hypothetical protein
MTSPTTTPTIADRPEAGRYEARIGKALAGFLEYRVLPRRIVLIHTEVLPEFEGRGVGGRLARHALDDARARGLGVTPACPFVAAYLERHPEDADLVTWGRRSPAGQAGYHAGDGTHARGSAD